MHSQNVQTPIWEEERERETYQNQCAVVCQSWICFEMNHTFLHLCSHSPTFLVRLHILAAPLPSQPVRTTQCKYTYTLLPCPFVH